MLPRRPHPVLWLAPLMLALLAPPPVVAQNAPSAPDGTQAPPDLSPAPPDMSKIPWSPVRRNAAPGNTAAGNAAPTFQVNVKLVNVFTSVADSDGAPYGGLEKQDFRLFEDDVEQKIAVFERHSELPLSIAIAMDTSLSTRKDLPLEISAARKFVRDLLTPRDAIALYSFSTYVTQALPFTNNGHSIDDALDHLRTGPATALYDAILLSSQSLARRQGRKAIVLITDGGDTASRADYPEALRAAELSEALIYSIIVVPIEADAGRDLGGEHALIQLSHDTGGGYYYASSLAQLDEAFRRIGDQLRTEYLLAYYPLNRAGRDFRRIRVELTPQALESAGRPLTVRHRAGYYAGKSE